jgi:hypothetical protein
MFAEVQIIAKQIRTAGRSLSIPSRCSPQFISAGSVRVRPKTSVAAMAESVVSSPHELPVSSVHSSPPALVAATEYAAHSEQGSELSAVGSDTSFPTRGWASAAGSVHGEAGLAMNERTRSCYLCLKPGHLVMEFPLLGSDVDRPMDTCARITPRVPYPTYHVYLISRIHLFRSHAHGSISLD